MWLTYKTRLWLTWLAFLPSPRLALQGRVVNFKNAVIILTSNIGSATILESMNASDFEGMKNTVTQQVGAQHSSRCESPSPCRQEGFQDGSSAHLATAVAAGLPAHQTCLPAAYSAWCRPPTLPFGT